MGKPDLEKDRKRQFAFLCLGFCVPLLLGFTIVDVYEGDLVEAIINIVMAIILIACFLVIRKSDAEIIIYRLALFLLALIFIYNVIIGSGEGTVVFWLFIFPLVFMFFLGKREGGLYSLLFLCVLGIVFLDPISWEIHTYSKSISLRLLASLVLVTYLAYSLEASREKYGIMLFEEHSILQIEKQNLEEALGKIKTLKGLIPICSHCKKIRDDQGFWQQVEIYVRDHSSAEFSHGICPDCLVQHYKLNEDLDGESKA